MVPSNWFEAGIGGRTEEADDSVGGIRECCLRSRHNVGPPN